MRPPCELIVRYVLPAFRSLVARELIQKHNLSQMAAAERLGTTQAAVSYYLYSKRGDKIMKQLEAMSSVRSVAEEVADGIASRRISFADSITRICELCIALRDNNIICSLHHDFTELPEDCQVCPDIAQR